MAVQTRSVLKTYFETGDKPTSAQFGDLIDSALMANAISSLNASSWAAVGNGVFVNAYSSTLSVNLSALEAGESCVINKLGTASICNAAISFSGKTTLRYAAGYSDVSADATGVMSYAVLVINSSVALINRAFYK